MNEEELKQPNMREKILNIGKEVINLEATEIVKVANNLTDDFVNAVITLSKIKGRLIVTGLGKSGLIGKKIAATLTSVGTSSIFLHPVEALHGDIGVVSKSDILLAISYSGETDEMLRLIPFFKKNKNFIISMTNNKISTLSKNSDCHLNIKVEKEACPYSLAPTSSTTATLVLGDALAVALMKINNFKEKDFAKFHPSGSIGKRLLLNVRDVMQSVNLPRVEENDNILDVVKHVSKGKLGLCLVGIKQISGIITDGDLRRAMEKHKKIFFDLSPVDIMTVNPIFIKPNSKIIDAQELFIKHKIGSLLVGNSNKVVGVIQVYDINL
jgi:arabinose-5-phosphate isomerase